MSFTGGCFGVGVGMVLAPHKQIISSSGKATSYLLTASVPSQATDFVTFPLGYKAVSGYVKLRQVDPPDTVNQLVVGSIPTAGAKNPNKSSYLPRPPLAVFVVHEPASNQLESM